MKKDLLRNPLPMDLEARMGKMRRSNISAHQPASPSHSAHPLGGSPTPLLTSYLYEGLMPTVDNL